MSSYYFGCAIAPLGVLAFAGRLPFAFKTVEKLKEPLDSVAAEASVVSATLGFGIDLLNFIRNFGRNATQSAVPAAIGIDHLNFGFASVAIAVTVVKSISFEPGSASA